MDQLLRAILIVALVLNLSACGGGGSSGGDVQARYLVYSKFAAVYSFEETTGVTAYNGVFNDAHGQIFGGTRTAGKVGSSLDFSRTTGALVRFAVMSPTEGISFTFPDTQLAVGGWFRPLNLQTNQYCQIFGGSGSGVQSFAMEIDGGSVRLVLYQDGNPSQPVVVASTSTPLADGEWVHVVATYDGTVGKIYINGTLDSTTNITLAIPDVVNDLYLTFPGQVDEFFFAGWPLTAQDVQSIYLDPEPTPPDYIPPAPHQEELLVIAGGRTFGPTAHYGFDEASGTVVANSLFPELNGELSAGSRTAGIVGGAVDLSPQPTANVHFSILGTRRVVFPRNSLTIATWIKPENLASGAAYHLFGGGYSGLQSTKLILEDGFVEWFVDGNYSDYLVLKSNTHVSSGEWTHVAVTYDTNRAILYINGIQDAAKDITIPIPEIVNDFYLGGVPITGGAFPGLMDEFYLSSDVFTPQQIAILAKP